MYYSRLLTGLVLLTSVAAGCADSTAPVPRSAQFIVNGTPTGEGAFENVGALLYRRSGGIVGCTGSLISETVFLTAAHCVDFLSAASQVYVSFEADIYPVPSHLIAASAFYFDPEYNHDKADLHDIAVVILPKSSTKGITPLTLPPAGYLDQLAARGQLASTLFVNVGYGFGTSYTGEPRYTYDGLRKYSKSEFMALQPYWLGLLMQTNATGEGGDCFGDSGGPKFVDGDFDVIVAIVSSGDANCRATTWDYRLDTSSARNFLGQFVNLP